MNDAIGITVREVEAQQPKVDKVVSVIMTDGEENSSRGTHDAVRGLIEQKEKEGNWTFIFLGAGLMFLAPSIQSLGLVAWYEAGRLDLGSQGWRMHQKHIRRGFRPDSGGSSWSCAEF